jgi:predicted DNA-binding protein (UPF0278 family)
VPKPFQHFLPECQKNIVAAVRSWIHKNPPTKGEFQISSILGRVTICG